MSAARIELATKTTTPTRTVDHHVRKEVNYVHITKSLRQFIKQGKSIRQRFDNTNLHPIIAVFTQSIGRYTAVLRHFIGELL